MHSPTEFAATHAEVAGALVLDVRRQAAYQAAPTRLAGSQWRDPATVESWVADLPGGTDIVVYCVYGHEVSQSTALRLRAAGLNARYLDGGIVGWEAAGRPVEAKETAA
jgi:superoxide dismutase, Fe-Mn family